MIELIKIGQSKTNIKIIPMSRNYDDNEYTINKSNWIGNFKYNDTFKVTITNGTCICKRTDKKIGWNMNLIIKSKFTIPIFFINLKKDVERLIFIKNILNKISDKKHIFRIDGVNHKIGLEGCRLAHINAHVTAINKGYNYYIITEDDIQPLVENDKIMDYIYKAKLFKPDLVLFECLKNLEKKIKLNRINENMYQLKESKCVFGSGTGCYLCSRQFGKKLVRLWSNYPYKHIDYIWQMLWKSNKVYFHRPQLFHQKGSYSNQHDIDYREEQRPFDWKKYESVSNK